MTWDRPEFDSVETSDGDGQIHYSTVYVAVLSAFGGFVGGVVTQYLGYPLGFVGFLIPVAAMVTAVSMAPSAQTIAMLYGDEYQE